MASSPGAEAAAPATTEPDWLADLRRHAQERFHELPVPGGKDKGWEFTDLSGLDLDSCRPPESGDIAAEPVHAALVETEAGPAIAGIDGRAERHGSGEPEAVIVSTLERAVAECPELVEPYLGSLVAGRDKFAAQNTAGWRAGAFVYVPAGIRVEEPVVVSATQATGGAMLWRTLVVLEEGAELALAEQYLSADDELDGYFNPVTELIVGDGAKLTYLCVQDLSERTWILGSQRAQVARDAALHWIGLGLGSAQGKLRMETDLSGRGASARVTGAYVGHGTQHIDYDTTQEHFAPDTTSDLAFRGILRDRATAVWGGMIKVDPGAQHTNAFQESRNLLLSEHAHADAIPGLEIEANDVRCTHAATVGRMDEGQLFYLMTRGLTRPEAERLLVEGFLEVVVGRLEDSGGLDRPVRLTLQRELERVLA